MTHAQITDTRSLKVRGSLSSYDQRALAVYVANLVIIITRGTASTRVMEVLNTKPAS